MSQPPQPPPTPQRGLIAWLSARQVELISGAVLLAVSAGLAALFVPRHLDRSFLIYRYARNLAGGAGFAYNAGESILNEAIAPLYAALLALGSLATADLPFWGNVAGATAVALGGLILYGLAYPAGKWTAAAAAGIYLAFPLLWGTLGLETPLWMMLGLLAVWLHLRRQGIGAAVVLGLATLMRPEIVVLGVILVADSLVQGRPLRPAPAWTYAGLVMMGLLIGVANFEAGGPLPALPAAPEGHLLPGMSGANAPEGLAALIWAALALSWLWVGLPLLALLGLFKLRGQRRLILLGGWAILHLISLTVLQAATYPWNFAPLIPAVAGLAALGLSWTASIIKPARAGGIAGGVLALLIAGAAGQSYTRVYTATSEQAAAWQALIPAPAEEAYGQAGTWLRDNTPPGVWVGTTQAGLLGYTSERFLLDYQGLLHPDLADAYARRDGGWWLGAYTPDYVVLRASEYELLDNYSPANDPWFTASYAEVMRFADDNPLLIYQRMVTPSPLTRQLVSMVTYPEGLILNSIATDFTLNPLESGRMGRISLEWLLNEAITQPRHVAIRIQSREGTIAALANQTVDFSGWPAGRLITTYHTLELLPGLPPGIYDLAIGLGPDPLNLTWQTIAQAKIPFQLAAEVGGISGVRAEFGDIALRGYRLARTEAGLEVLLMWQAVREPQADYRVLIQIRDPQGVVVAQLETEPHSGIYPTSIWSAGEQVPDTYLLDVSAVPAGDYEAYVGLIGPDGRRLLTLEGQDMVRLGHVSINAP
jgi:hypothetical protein